MFGEIFGSIGGVVGKYFGGGILSTIGRFAGRTLGTYFDRMGHEADEHYNFATLKESFRVSVAQYGAPIPLVFGTVKVPGKIIWVHYLKALENDQIRQRYFAQNDLLGGRNIQSTHHRTCYEYYLSFAVAICEGEITEISKVWANGNVINLHDYRHRIYYGSQNQHPDHLLVNKYGHDQSPAFRGLAYVMFEDMPLADFGNNIPSIAFEVTRRPQIKPINYNHKEVDSMLDSKDSESKASVDIKIEGKDYEINNWYALANTEDLIEEMIMIPGCGEYVYDTHIQYKTYKGHFGNVLAKEAINCHNPNNIADSVYSLNQLQSACRNIKWVAVVVCWFGTNLHAEHCRILPAVEFGEDGSEFSDTWRVANYNRQTAKKISLDKYDIPNYGGTVNDASVIRYLQELKRRGLKIMFYPMFFLDVKFKPWRGHVGGSPDGVRHFFNDPQGYNNFILHYASLTRDYADAFVIGSEMIGLTKIREGNSFPAVNELVNLAFRVKEIMGARVKITYAADWSEYHHTDGGWYNLDGLWACPAIDMIGIDAYFPITDTMSSAISDEEIRRGFTSGEGYDYYIHKGTRTPLEPKYAWKNLRYWWENHHTNPDGRVTEWQPRMKPIWFTEYGFPSVDKATNQPNVFFDPYCIDGGIPKHSSGKIDFAIQRRAIRLFLSYWREQEFIGQMFLWTWDARPYPAWPHMNIWMDGYLWQRGHWVNNKFGSSSMVSIIFEISQRCNININDLDVGNFDETISGIIFNKNISCLDALNILRIRYFFDIIVIHGKYIKFTKRINKNAKKLDTSFLLPNHGMQQANFLDYTLIADSQIISQVNIHFLNRSKDYKSDSCHVNNELISSKARVKIDLPMVLSDFECENLARLILTNAYTENKVIEFALPPHIIEIEPGDFFKLDYRGHNYIIRIIKLALQNDRLKVTAIVDDITSYYDPSGEEQEKLIFTPKKDTKFHALDLPVAVGIYQDSHITVYLQSEGNSSLYADIIAGLPGNMIDSGQKITTLQNGAIIGTVDSYEHHDAVSVFLIDELSKITVFCPELPKAPNKNWHLALFGNEIIYFSNFNAIGNNLFTLNNFIRGAYATENYLTEEKIGQPFILLNIGANQVALSAELEQQNITLHVKPDLYQTLNYKNKLQKLLAPFIKECRIKDNQLMIEWYIRSLAFDDWLYSKADDPANYHTELTIYYTKDNGNQYREDFKTEGSSFALNLEQLQISPINLSGVEVMIVNNSGLKSEKLTLNAVILN